MPWKQRRTESEYIFFHQQCIVSHLHTFITITPSQDSAAVESSGGNERKLEETRTAIQGPLQGDPLTPSHIHMILCNIQDEKLRLEEAISRLVAGDLGEVGVEESERVKAI